MMNYNHRTSGFAVWVTMDAVTQLAGVGMSRPAAILGAWICSAAAAYPDIDNPDSGPAHTVDRLIPGLPALINRVCGHRGATHWATTAVALGALLGWLSWVVAPVMWFIALAVGLGWLTHALGDCPTYMGAPLFGPFSKRMIHITPYGYRFPTGGTFELDRVTPAMQTWAVVAAIASITATVTR